MHKRKKYDKGSIGYILSKLIEERGLTKVAFYSQLGITKTYFFDLLNGRVSPTPEMQIKIVNILKPCNEDRTLFFELVAKRRNEVPVDIALYFQSRNRRDDIRKNEDYIKIFNGGGSNNG